jgi:phosphatidylglycerol:prolipoprotein diacylglycerol transferase
VIPYFELREIPIGGGRSLAVFGTLVAVGIFAGAWFAERRARLTGIPPGEMPGAILSAVVPGVLVAHLVAVLPHADGWSPAVLLEFWNGMSSFGGLAGAFLGLGVYYWRARLVAADGRRPRAGPRRRVGIRPARLHAGARSRRRPSEFLLAMRFPDGPRHDLGLYELLYTVVVLVPAVVVLNRRPRAAGTSVAVLALLYVPFRFLADFLRQTDLPGADARYLRLTVGQFGCVVLALVGVVAMRIRRQAVA